MIKSTSVLMTYDRERELIATFQNTQCKKSVDELISSNMGFIKNLVNKMGGYKLMSEDLMQQAYIGYIIAINKFDITFQCRLNTFAQYHVLSEMREYAINNIKIAKVAKTKAERKLFFNLRKMQIDYIDMSKCEANKRIAQELAVSMAEVEKMDARLSTQPIAYNSVEAFSDTSDTNADSFLVLSSSNSDVAFNYENERMQITAKEVVNNALKSLNYKQKDILVNRFCIEEKVTLKELSSKHQISIQRVEQIQKEALAKIKMSISV